jgi:hypothetical protein
MTYANPSTAAFLHFQLPIDTHSELTLLPHLLLFTYRSEHCLYLAQLWTDHSEGKSGSEDHRE